MPGLVDLSPDAFATELLRQGNGRGWLAWNTDRQQLQTSHGFLEEVAESVIREPDFDELAGQGGLGVAGVFVFAAPLHDITV